MMSADKPTAWLLNDGRIGNSNQLKAISHYLAEKLNITECKISFNRMICLPNIINFFFSTGVKFHNSTTQVKPNFILSAGRRSALAAAQLKKLYPDVKIIQIMRPNLPAKYFDFIVTPKHDDYKKSNMQTILTPNLINKNTLKTASKEWKTEFAKIKKPILAVIIGGDTKHKKISDATIVKLCNDLKKLKSQSDCHIYLTTSRRTSNSNLEIIKNMLSDEAELYLWQAQAKKNPYLAMLAYCHSILISADSISMISDGLSSGKAVYILENDFGDKKHHDFVKNLKKQNVVMPSDKLFKEGLKDYKFPSMNSAKDIADAVMESFKPQKNINK